MDLRNLIGYEWFGFLVVWLLAAFSRKRQVRTEPLGSRMRYVLTLVIAALLLSYRGPRSWPLHWRLVPGGPAVGDVAFVLTTAGIAFALWARFFLGRNWSSSPGVAEGHQLIRQGPYGWVRHPIYSGILLALFGTAVAKGHLGAFISLVFFAAAFHIKSRMEERFMLEQFGADYTRYQHEVKALIPFLL